ncbi:MULTISPECIES: hypothetical protein [unclassified Acinetobacter]|uniref:hypothetical protein n=1 Tax=unclassified Acinetobacter TaxID=196816 RepID=UPI0015D406AC|nr:MULTISPECIES: hypothetical protein [unclassified Acinetobacter]
MTREEFRANLYQTYVATGMHDQVLIQEYIEIAESFVFDQKKYTQENQEVLVKKLSKNSD